MTKLSMAEILEQTSKIGNRNKQIEFLRQHYSKHLHEALAFGYDERIQWLLPETDPPFTPITGEELKMNLHRECHLQKLYYFVAGGKGAAVRPAQRENMFIQLLESVDIKDAELLLSLKKKILPYGIDRQLIEDAYGKL